MSTNYVAVQWNRQKRLYDLVLVGGLGLYLAVSVSPGYSRLVFPTVQGVCDEL